MRKLVAVVAISIITAISAPAHSQTSSIQPFGLKFGTPLATAKPIRKVESGTWVVKPPLPSSLFDSYHVTASARIGICIVYGYAHPKNEPMSMDETYAVYDTTMAALKEKYGPPSSELEPRKSKGGNSTSMGYPLDTPDLPGGFWFANDTRDVSIVLSVISPTTVAITYASDKAKRCQDAVAVGEKAKASQGL